jgi:hypothetical protein
MCNHDIITILVTVVTRFGQLNYIVNYRYEPFGCLTILFHTPVVFINSSSWTCDVVVRCCGFQFTDFLSGLI